MYKRQLFLHTNGYPATHALTVKVQTALIPIESRESKSDASLIWAFLTGEILTFMVLGIIPWIVATLASHNIAFWNVPSIKDSLIGAFIFGTVGAIAGAVLGAVIIGIHTYFEEKNNFWVSIFGAIFLGVIFLGVLGILFGGVYGTIVNPSRPNNLVGIIFDSIGGILQGGFLACIVGGIAGAIIGLITSFLIWAILTIVNDWVSLLAAAFGLSVGLGFIVGFLQLSTLLALLITGTPFLYTLIYAPIKHQKLIIKYRNSEKNLIKP